MTFRGFHVGDVYDFLGGRNVSGSTIHPQEPVSRPRCPGLAGIESLVGLQGEPPTAAPRGPFAGKRGGEAEPTGGANGSSL